MNEVKDLTGDLRYVREVVQRSERRPAPRFIYILWALLCLVGFALIDLAPRQVGLFWTIAAPVGFVLSALFGWRHSVVTGAYSGSEGLQYMLHWLGTLVAVFLVWLLVASGDLSHPGLGRAILLVLALGYYLWGLHQVRAMVWVGILLALAYVALGFLGGPVWTITGVVVAVSLVAAAFLGEPGEQG
jgi:hypothetical protein